MTRSIAPWAAPATPSTLSMPISASATTIVFIAPQKVLTQTGPVVLTIALVGQQLVGDPQQPQATDQHQAGDLEQPDHTDGHDASEPRWRRPCPRRMALRLQVARAGCARPVRSRWRCHRPAPRSMSTMASRADHQGVENNSMAKPCYSGERIDTGRLCVRGVKSPSHTARTGAGRRSCSMEVMTCHLTDRESEAFRIDDLPTEELLPFSCDFRGARFVPSERGVGPAQRL